MLNGLTLDVYNAAVSYFNTSPAVKIVPISEPPVVPGGLMPGVEAVEIADGKVKLGVSVVTNGDLSAAAESWSRARIESATVEDDGTATLVVPATADKGFMILKSSGRRE